MGTTAFSKPYTKNYLPASIEAEDYDTDGQGISYGDTDSENAGKIAREDGVDIYTDKTGALYVTMLTDEWMKYTFEVKRAGTYGLSLNLMMPQGSSGFSVYFDDRLVFDRLGFISKASPQSFALYDLPNVYLQEGSHTITIQSVAQTVNLDYIKFTNKSGKGKSIPATAPIILPIPEKRAGADLEFPNINFFGDVEEQEEEASSIQAEFYVSENGNDSGSGSEQSPFLTIERAVLAVRTINKDMTGDIIVNIDSGTYTVTSPIKFTPADGGTNGYKIIYKGSDDLSSVISGGRKVEGFTQTPGKPFWEIPLKHDEYLYEFYVNDHRAKVASSEYKYQPTYIYDDPSTTQVSDGFIFSKASMPLKFDNFDGMMISNSFEWVYNLIPVAKIKDDKLGTIVSGKQPYASWYSQCLKLDFPVYFLNHISLLDNPGEFYYDKEAKKLYYYPLYGEKIEEAVGYIPISEGLIDIMGTDGNPVTNLKFSQLTYKHGQWKRTWEMGFAVDQAENYIDTPENYSWYSKWHITMPAQFQVSYTDGLEITNSRFENLSAVAIGFLDKVYNASVIGNSFFDIGSAAVSMGRGTHMEPLMSNSKNICKNIEVSNNFIRSTGQIYQSSPAITAYFINNCKISHNDIKDVPYTGVSLGWGWGNDEELCSGNEISYNRLDNVMHSMWDGSHIYTLGNLHGSVVEGNYFARTDAEAGGGTYYPDEGSDDIYVRNNVFENPRTQKLNMSHERIRYSNNYINVLVQKTRYFDPSEAFMSGMNMVLDGEWPDAAKKIIEFSGLEAKYKYLEEDYNSRNLPDVTIYTNLPRFVDMNTYITIPPGRDFITEGGEGIAFHDAEPWNMFDGFGAVDWGGRYWSIGYNSDNDPEWLQYHLKTDIAGDYKIIVEAAGATDSACEFYLDGNKIVSDGEVKGSGNWGVATHNHVGDVRLEANKDYILKFAFKKGAFNFNGIYLALKDGMGVTGIIRDANYVSLTEADVALPSEKSTVEIKKPAEISFSDISGHWAFDNIMSLARRGYINGNDDGSFAPDNGVTRAEALKMIMQAAGVTAGVYESGYSDVSKDDWFAPYVGGVLAQNILEPGGNLSPHYIMNRQDVAYLLLKVMKIMPNGTPKFPDSNEIGQLYIEYVAKAESLGLLLGDSEGYFNPSNLVTRAEMATLLQRVIEFK